MPMYICSIAYKVLLEVKSIFFLLTSEPRTWQSVSLSSSVQCNFKSESRVLQDF
jgi:hypothetical protein